MSEDRDSKWRAYLPDPSFFAAHLFENGRNCSHIVRFFCFVVVFNELPIYIRLVANLVRVGE